MSRNPPVHIRLEQDGDASQIRHVAIAAFSASQFGHQGEAELIERLRANCADSLSLVAEQDGRLIGQALFSPVIIEGAGSVGLGMGLGPLAVLPKYQRRGIGAELVMAGVVLLRDRGSPFVCVLGDPSYYWRFGFQPARQFGIYSEFGGAEDCAFQILWLNAPPAAYPRALAKYRPEFSELPAQSGSVEDLQHRMES